MATPQDKTVSPRTKPTDNSVADISIEIVSFDPLGSEALQIQWSVNVQLKQSNGSIDVVKQDLVPFLTAAEDVAIKAILARLRTKFGRYIR